MGKDKIIEIDNDEKFFEIPWVANGHPELKTKSGYPINEPPWGTLSKINLDAGKIDWQIPWAPIQNLKKWDTPLQAHSIWGVHWLQQVN